MTTMNAGGWRAAVKLAAAIGATSLVLTACGGAGGGIGPTLKRAAFTSDEFGVAVSPRVTRDPHPPRGGGRHLVGKPYTVRGKTYHPEPDPQSYVAQGRASWYGADFHGRRTANGEIFSANAISGAHPTLPLPSYVRVTNHSNGQSLLVRINDRGPYMSGRIIDLSYTAAKMLGYVNAGSTEVTVDYVGPAPLNGDDTRMLVASLNKRSQAERHYEGGDTRVALAAPDLVGGLIGVFGYADASAVDHGAAAAAAAVLAGQPPELDRGLEISLKLGDFARADEAIAVAEAFAVLGAVDEFTAEAGGRTVNRLVLSRLKPGVERQDVLDLASELGLTGLVLY